MKDFFITTSVIVRHRPKLKLLIHPNIMPNVIVINLNNVAPPLSTGTFIN
jgi:hypothetical protein